MKAVIFSLLILVVSSCHQDDKYLKGQLDVNDSSKLSYFYENGLLTELVTENVHSGNTRTYTFYENGNIMTVKRVFQDSMIERYSYYRNGNLESYYTGVNFWKKNRDIRGKEIKFHENGNVKDSITWD